MDPLTLPYARKRVLARGEVSYISMNDTVYVGDQVQRSLAEVKTGGERRAYGEEGRGREEKIGWDWYRIHMFEQLEGLRL